MLDVATLISSYLPLANDMAVTSHSHPKRECEEVAILVCSFLTLNALLNDSQLCFQLSEGI